MAIRYLKMLALILVGLTVLALLILYAAYQRLPAPAGTALSNVVFARVNVVDALSGKIRRNQDVFVEDGLISAIVDHPMETGPGAAVTIDADGGFMLPGFWDMHTHFWRPTARYLGPLMVMNGVMYQREMQSDCAGPSCAFNNQISESRALQTEIEREELLAPKIVALSSFMVHGPRVGHRADRYAGEPPPIVPTTYAQGAALATLIHERGPDFIKLYDSVTPDALAGLVAEAAELDLPFAGHVPKSLTLQEALGLGMRSIEHARMLPLACSKLGDRFAEDYRAWATGRSRNQPEFSERYQELLDNPSADACQAALSLWAESNTYYVPTHVTRMTDFSIVESPYTLDPRSRFLPSMLRDMQWSTSAEKWQKRYEETPADLDLFRSFFLRGLELSGRAHRLGIRILIGTDTGDVMIYPGFSFHDELQLLSFAGIANDALLRAATREAAVFSDMQNQHGSLKVGNKAHLFIVTGNPLEDISNTQSITGVYYRGHYYDETDREAVLAQVARQATGWREVLSMGWPLLTRILPLFIFTSSGDDLSHPH